MRQNIEYKRLCKAGKQKTKYHYKQEQEAGILAGVCLIGCVLIVVISLIVRLF